MNLLLQELTIERPKPLPAQIGAHIRKLIVTGKIAAGAEMPSTRQLARMWNTHVPTIHKALVPLVKEGLVVRINGKGTFVGQRRQRLQCAGIYAPTDFLELPQLTPRRAILSVLHERLVGDQVEPRLFLDSRSKEQRAEPLPALLTEVANRSVQAVISLATVRENRPWQEKLPVAFSCLSSIRLPTCVMLDAREFVSLSLEALAAQGCRSVGLILGSLPQQDPAPPDIADGMPQFLGTFVDKARDLHLAVRNDWVITPPDSAAQSQFTPFGFESFRRLWRQAERPDGLVVFFDEVARGTITAMLAEQVSVPRDLKLVIHKNERSELFCPFPVTVVGHRETELVAALLEQVQRQLNGETCEMITVPYRVLAKPQAT